MFLQFALVVVLAFSGLTRSAFRAQDSSGAQHGVDQIVARASARTAITGLSGASGARSDGVVLKDLNIVVPPVEPSGDVVKPVAPLETQAAAGVVVADQLVAPKRVE